MQPTFALLGRSEEVASIRSALHEAGRGRGCVITVEGEAGIGKTRLIQEALEDARHRGCWALVGRADELERSRPFGPLLDAVGGFDRSLAPKGAHDAAAEIGQLIAGDAWRASDPEFVMIEALVAFLGGLAFDRPTVLAVDDLQWADAATLRAIWAVARRLHDLPLVVVIGLRPTPRSTEASRLLNLLQGRAKQIVLGPLGEDDVGLLAGAVAAGVPGPRLLNHARGTAGNPLFVIELVSALKEEGLISVVDGEAETEARASPPNLRLTVLRRLSAVVPESLDVLRVASVLGTSFSLADLGAVVNRSAVDLLSCLDAAFATGVLGEVGERVAFRHDLVREALYEELPRPVRQALHRQAGAALAAAGSPARTVAEQFSLAAEPRDTQAARWLRKAAREAATTSPGVAADLAMRSLGLAEPIDTSRDVLIGAIVTWLWLVGRTDELERLATDALTGPLQPPAEATIRSGLANTFTFRDGRILAAIEQLDAAAELADESHGSWIRAIAGFSKLQLGRVDEALADAKRAVTDGKRLGNDHTTWVGLVSLATSVQAAGGIEEALELAQQALAVERRTATPWLGYLCSHSFIARALVAGGRIDEAQRTLQEGLERAERLGLVVWLPMYHTALAERAFHAGQWDDALAEAEVSIELMRESGAFFWAPGAYATQALVAFRRSAPHVSQGVLAQVQHVLGTHEMLWDRDALCWTEAQLLEAAGRPAEALRVLQRGWQVTMPLRYLSSWWRLIAPDLARLAVALGDLEVARAVVAEVEEGARRMGTVAVGGVALRCRGIVEADPDLLVAAADAYRKGPWSVEAAAASADAAAALTRRGWAPEAKTFFEESLAAYERVGAVRDVARLRAEMRAAGIRRGSSRPRRRPAFGWEALTDSELSVARLVAEGLTNRQVAERLYLSRFTVETHLKHIFAKLGATSRVELAAEVTRRAPA